MCLSTKPTSKWHSVPGFPNESPEIAKVGTSATLGLHNFVCRPLIRKSCIPYQDLFNNMWHATYTQGNWVDSRLLVVGSQIVNLAPGLSFGHNLCFKCPNGSCEPILDIQVSITFQWYKELFNAMGFDPCNCSLKIRESTRTPTPKMGTHLGMWVFILTLSHIPGLPSWLAPLQALALVASRKLGLRHFSQPCTLITTIKPN